MGWDSVRHFQCIRTLAPFESGKRISITKFSTFFGRQTTTHFETVKTTIEKFSFFYNLFNKYSYGKCLQIRTVKKNLTDKGISGAK
jgi:hypothetical protein